MKPLESSAFHSAETALLAKRDRKRFCRATFAAVVYCLLSAASQGSELLVVNTSTHTLTCAAGRSAPFQVGAGSTYKFNVSAPVNSVDCGGNLRTRAMGLTPTGTSRVLILNGRQKRVLNALLYSSIPTDPKAGYTPLVQWLTQTYQNQHPDILLNLVLDPDIDSGYDFNNMQKLLDSEGVDVAELDTVFLKFLADSHSILPLSIDSSDAWPVAKQAVAVGGQTYGIPSWLCSDFLFSLKPDDSIVTYDQLRSFFGSGGQGHTLEADLDGKWTIPALYIQAYTQMHHSMSASDAATKPIDAAVVARMTQVGRWCERDGSNPCIDNTFHNGTDGTVEQHFNDDHALGDIGFSERSFFLSYYAKSEASLHLVPFPWGGSADTAHLVYVDAFVVNAHTCKATPCKDDAIQLARFVTAPDTKKQIVFSKDLGGKSPARHLLPASQAFYRDAEVSKDPIYSQVRATFLSRKLLPYLNDFTPQFQYTLLTSLCAPLMSASPSWKCKPPAPPSPGS